MSRMIRRATTLTLLAGFVAAGILARVVIGYATNHPWAVAVALAVFVCCYRHGPVDETSTTT